MGSFVSMTYHLTLKTRSNLMKFCNDVLGSKNVLKAEIPMLGVPNKHISNFNTQNNDLPVEKVLKICDRRSHIHPLASK